jgi:hypothetical protein
MTMRQREPEVGLDELSADPRRAPEPAESGAPVRIALGGERAIEVASRGNKTVLRLQGEHRQQLDIEIRFDLNGPVVTVQAPKLEIAGAKDISAACETFTVDASKRIDLRSQGEMVQTAKGTARTEARRVEVEASPGAILLKANDEVQALGEMILLNSEHPRTAAPMPGWVKSEPAAASSPLPAEASSGDASVISELLAKPPNDADP